MAEETGEIGDITLIESRRSGFRPWWLAAAALVFLALWGWRELDIRRMREIEASDRAEIRQLSEENQQLEQRLDRTLTAVASPQSRTIDLTGPQKTTASGKIFVDPTAGRAIVVISDLPPNDASKDYQLWITRIDTAKPQSALVFDVPPSRATTLTIDKVPPPAEIKSVGVTLEDKGGAESPHGEFLLTGKP